MQAHKTLALKEEERHNRMPRLNIENN